MTAPQSPVLVIATTDAESLGILERELRVRYGSEYPVVVRAWLISLGVAAAHGLIEDETWLGFVRSATATVFGALEGVSLLRYGEELDWSAPQSIVYVAVLVTLLGLGLWALRAGRSDQDAGGVQQLTQDRDVVL